jgi:2-octaprenyl-6-methoxyphenol hydroxylase
MKKFDAVIIGAGLNGLAAALALAGNKTAQPLNVAVVDRYDPARFASSSFDSRASALTLATQTMFKTLGVWNAIEPFSQNMETIRVSDGLAGESRPSLLNFDQIPGQKSAAAMVENHYIYAGLLAELAKSKHIELLTGQNIRNIAFGPGLAQIQLGNDTTLKSSLIIGADGRNSLSRQKASLEMLGWDYAQSAITLTLEHESPHNGEAEEHFNPQGVFAILPLKGNRSSIVWTESHDDAARIYALDDTAFMEELAKRFGSHRGKLSLSGARHVHKLSLGLAKEFTAPRLALIGDAAHIVHPLAGLGLNLGFKDVACLADCILDSARLGQDVGSTQTLDHYSQGRRFDTVSTVYALDGLNRLFSNDISPLRIMRDLGLRVVDKAPNLKALFMKEAAGQTGSLPRLMRGLAA